MPSLQDLNNPSDFIQKAQKLVEENAANENFGVSELAAELSTSRSTLLRKIKSETNLSASVFIREVRLALAKDLLKEGKLSVSEVSYEVGFGSVSYFVKCFREQYGMPPGQMEKEETTKEAAVPAEKPVLKVASEESSSSFPNWLKLTLGAIVVAFVAWFAWPSSRVADLEKSIAVLPFSNESADSTNRYFVNGLMEATLSNLQKVQDLRVISRTSSEKYRNSKKSSPEIGEELQVAYLVEGSGQKIGARVLLHIKLIDAAQDKPIWSAEYKREIDDIFDLQQEVAQKITAAIQVMVRPAELEQMQKRPTENLVAYDYYLQALEPYFERSNEGLKKAISLFEKAVEADPEFAQAYADMAIAYYFLDLFQQEKSYTDQINRFSDKALLYDPKSDISLIAKACYYLQTKEYRLALPHLEKALEYKPNSEAVLHMLADFYAYHIPNTAKYLEYALKGIQIGVLPQDSIARSYSYLQLANALVQAGFLEEAHQYITESLALDPTNYYAPHLQIFIDFSMSQDYAKTKRRLVHLWKRDTTRLDILQDVAKLYYIEKEWDSAYYYFHLFDRICTEKNLNLYPHERAKMAYVFRAYGDTAAARKSYLAYKEYCGGNQSIYKEANWAILKAYEGKISESMDHLEAFAKEEHFQFWFLLLQDEPQMELVKQDPRFETVRAEISKRFWEDHEHLRQVLEAQSLL